MEIIGEIQKNKKEKIIISTNEYMGHKFIDLRIYFENDNGDYKPTKKGIAISPKIMKEVLEFIIKGAEKM